MKCECNPTAFPFLCARHGCRKTENMLHLCQRKQEPQYAEVRDYFDVWEEGHGPGQFEGGNKPPVARPFRLGDFVAHCIESCTFGLLKQRRGCGCKARQATLNRWSDRFLKWLRSDRAADAAKAQRCSRSLAATKQRLDAAVGSITEIQQLKENGA